MGFRRTVPVYEIPIHLNMLHRVRKDGYFSADPKIKRKCSMYSAVSICLRPYIFVLHLNIPYPRREAMSWSSSWNERREQSMCTPPLPMRKNHGTEKKQAMKLTFFFFFLTVCRSLKQPINQQDVVKALFFLAQKKDGSIPFHGKSGSSSDFFFFFFFQVGSGCGCAFIFTEHRQQSYFVDPKKKKGFLIRATSSRKWIAAVDGRVSSVPSPPPFSFKLPSLPPTSWSVPYILLINNWYNMYLVHAQLTIS